MRDGFFCFAIALSPWLLHAYNIRPRGPSASRTKQKLTRASLQEPSRASSQEELACEASMAGFHRAESAERTQPRSTTTPRRRGFHTHEVLPFGFEEENQAARRAARRAQNYARKVAAREREEREQELAARWYARQEPAVESGPALAKRRVRERKRREAAEERRKQEMQASQRWYLQNPAHELAPSAVDAAQEHTTQFFATQREEARARDEAEEIRQKHIEEALLRVFAARDRSFAVSRGPTLEEQRLRNAVPVFKPGPYTNKYIETYAREAVGLPRRVFSHE